MITEVHQELFPENTLTYNYVAYATPLLDQKEPVWLNPIFWRRSSHKTMAQWADLKFILTYGLEFDEHTFMLLHDRVFEQCRTT